MLTKSKEKGLGFSEKTLWDWLQLLGVPVVLALIAFFFNVEQSITSFQLNDRQHQHDLQIANDQQQEAALQGYLDHISTWLLGNQLRNSKPNDVVRSVARAQTIITLRQLNPTRKGILVQFLYESGLITPINGKPVIELAGVDLSNANLSAEVLDGADLSFVNLHNVNLFAASLKGTNLSDADLSDARMCYSFLTGTNMGTADLRGADLNGAMLDHVNLDNARLESANVTKDQLAGASLKNTTLPNASTSNQETIGACNK